MSRFLPEPAGPHGSAAPAQMPVAASPKVAVLLVNLGSPAAPTAAALRPYLKQFLSDPRVIELPRLLWWGILNGIILNTRPAKSAAKYASVWLPEGAPLKVYTEQQASALQHHFTGQGQSVTVAWAMRYGTPSIPAVLSQLKAQQIEKILIVPLYPQYAASTTATVMDEVASWLQQTRNQPAIRSLRCFHDDAGYIGALAAQVRAHWQRVGPLARGDKLLMSFHGLPKKSLDDGDPYYCHCQKTGRLLAETLGLDRSQYEICFQSRFGKAEWLQPYTAATVQALAASGTKRLDVLCPGFVADCLETLEEIAMEVREDFLGHGGEQYHYIPCVNTSPDWLEALSALVSRELAGWV